MRNPVYICKLNIHLTRELLMDFQGLLITKTMKYAYQNVSDFLKNDDFFDDSYGAEGKRKVLSYNYKIINLCRLTAVMTM